jgi:hypothetical protein
MHHMHGRNRAGKIALMVLAGIAFMVALTFALMYLWNWLVPAVIGWKTIDFWQAAGLLLLSRLLFGFRGGWGWGHHRMHCRGRMAERWDRMTPEEREKFREGMRARC